MKVTGQQKRSDLPQGGLEIPCLMMLEHGDEKIIKKARQLLEEKNFHEAEPSEAEPTDEEPTQNCKNNDTQTPKRKTQSKYHGKIKSTVIQKGKSKKQRS